MDRTGFMNAPPVMREKERLLLSKADLVFTGWPSLYPPKKINTRTFTVCRAVSPTKTLEYMAAEKPIVSRKLLKLVTC
jgi:hypothetical protein